MSNGGGLHAAVREERGKAVPESGGIPGEIDVTRPSVARMYDYYLGGKDNYAADREAARIVLGAAPDVPLAALENREFLKRVMRYLAAERGIGQFVDIGPGLPTQGNVHQLARQHNPGAKVAYIDNDATVLAHAGHSWTGYRVSLSSPATCGNQAPSCKPRSWLPSSTSRARSRSS